MLLTLDASMPLFSFAPDEKGGAGAPSNPEPKESEEPVEPEEDAEEGEDPDAAEEPTEDDPDAAPLKKEPWFSSKRGKRVYAGYKQAQQYQRFGSPEQVESSLKRLQYYDDQITAAEKKGEGDEKETDELRERREKVKKELGKMYPALDKLDEVTNDTETYRESLRFRAAEATVEIMDAQDLDSDDDATYQAFAGVLQEIIAKDKRLYTIYVSSPERAVKLAAEKYARPFKAAGEREKGARLIKSKEPHKGLPKSAPRSSGGPSPAPDKPEPKNIQEAEKLFIAGLKQTNRG